MATTSNRKRWRQSNNNHNNGNNNSNNTSCSYPPKQQKVEKNVENHMKTKIKARQTAVHRLWNFTKRICERNKKVLWTMNETKLNCRNDAKVYGWMNKTTTISMMTTNMTINTYIGNIWMILLKNSIWLKTFMWNNFMSANQCNWRKWLLLKINLDYSWF